MSHSHDGCCHLISQNALIVVATNRHTQSNFHSWLDPEKGTFLSPYFSSSSSLQELMPVISLYSDQWLPVRLGEVSQVPSLQVGFNLTELRDTALSPVAAAASDTNDTAIPAPCSAASPSRSTPPLHHHHHHHQTLLLIRHFPFGDVERQEDRMRGVCV